MVEQFLTTIWPGCFNVLFFGGFHTAPTLLVGGVLSIYIWNQHHPTSHTVPILWRGFLRWPLWPQKGVTVELTHPTECLSLIGSWVKGRWITGPVFSLRWPNWGLAGESDQPYLAAKVCEEILVSLCLAPLRFTDWRASVDVMASDASWRFCDGQASHQVGNCRRSTGQYFGWAAPGPGGRNSQTSPVGARPVRAFQGCPLWTRLHLDERSKLFYDLADRLREIYPLVNVYHVIAG